MKEINALKFKRSMCIVVAIFCLFITTICFGGEEQGSDEIDSKLKDPKQIVKIRPKSGFDYYGLSKAFDQNDLPSFYEILNDPKSSGYELQQAVKFIGHISDRGNHKAAKVLIDYVQKEVKWDESQSDADDITHSKWIVMGWIGYFKGEDIESFLKKAITQEGIKEIVNKWYKGVPKKVFSEEAVLENLRGYAVKGLAYSDNPDIQKLVKSEYEREKQDLIKSNKKSGHYFNQLCDAMARIDIIKDIGIEAHKALSDGTGSYTNLYLKHVVKYTLNKPVLDINDLNIMF